MVVDSYSDDELAFLVEVAAVAALEVAPVAFEEEAELVVIPVKLTVEK